MGPAGPAKADSALLHVRDTTSLSATEQRRTTQQRRPPATHCAQHCRRITEHHNIECERKAMPKNKTHSGMKKRVKVTGTGKLTHAGSGKRHNLESKPTSRTRRLDGAKEIAKVDVPRVKRLLGL
jgi:large subunit ribosomal protein L35